MSSPTSTAEDILPQKTQTPLAGTPTQTLVPTVAPQKAPTASLPASLPASTPTVPPVIQPSPPSQAPTATETSPQPSSTQAVPSPTLTSLAPQANTTQSCTDTAGFFGDVTIPDNTPFQQNVSFVKTWRIRNEGTCTWGPGYTLIFYGGNAMGAPLSNPMPVIEPGKVGEVSVNLKSPASAGTFTGHWVFQNPSGKRFGVNSNGIDTIWVKIGVSMYDAQKTPVPVVAGPSASTPPATCAAQQNTGYEDQVLQKINEERQKAGLPVLKLSPQLSKAAYGHSLDMGCNKFVDHVGSNGSTWYNRITNEGYKYNQASENIYVGDPQFGGTPEGAMKWWMNSKIHRDNILSTKVTEIGIGYAFVSTSQYKGYYTLNFARP
jgi:uncharacterized protein YkwD